VSQIKTKKTPIDVYLKERGCEDDEHEFKGDDEHMKKIYTTFFWVLFSNENYLKIKLLLIIIRGKSHQHSFNKKIKKD